MDELQAWSAGLTALLERVAPLFATERSRERVARYVDGLLADVERKNGWQLAEQAGEATPYAMQQFLFRGTWDADGLCRHMRGYLIEALAEPEGVLVADETGFLKKGTHSVGVARQYSGTAGRVENCQIAVMLGYVSSRGRGLLDRALYLPATWTDDPERCRKAGVPESVAFRTKPELALDMLQRAWAEGVPARWVAADSVYGDNPTFRETLEDRPIGYVLGTSLNDARVGVGLRVRRVKEVVEALSPDAWQRLSAGDGSQGQRLYDWQLVELSVWRHRGWQRALLVRRSMTDPTDLKVYRCHYPAGTPVQTLVSVAGCRWTIETDIQEAKGEVGLDHYEVRSWDGWHRHISLALLAHAYLAVTKAASDAADLAAAKGGPRRQTTPTMAAFKASRGLLCL